MTVDCTVISRVEVTITAIVIRYSHDSLDTKYSPSNPMVSPSKFHHHVHWTWTW